MAKVKIIRPALMTTPDGVKFRKAYGVAAWREPYEDKPKVMVLAFVLPFLTAFALLMIAQWVSSIPDAVQTALRFTAVLILAAEFLFAFINHLRYSRAIRDFYRSAIERGGETVDATSEKVVAYFKDWGVLLAIIAGVGLLVAFAISTAVAFVGSAGNADSFSGYVPSFYLITMSWNARNAMSSAVIFLDLDEGAIIGQTLFPYTVLGDLRETEANRYELWYEGKAVMRGTLPKETADALRETAAVVTKYASHLNAGAEQIPVSSPKAWRPY